MRLSTCLTFTLLYSALSPAHGQYGPGIRYEPYALESGLHDNSGAEPAVTFREVVELPGTPWMWLHFSDCELGQASYLTLTSLKDGSRQRFDTRSWRDWRNSDAIVSGDAVEVQLIVAPGESGEIIWKFTNDGMFEFACLKPGHYEAGMRGDLKVSAK